MFFEDYCVLFFVLVIVRGRFRFVLVFVFVSCVFLFRFRFVFVVVSCSFAFRFVFLRVPESSSSRLVVAPASCSDGLGTVPSQKTW